MKGIKINHIIIALIVIVLLTIGKISRLFTDYWWFESLGFADVFLTIIESKLIIFSLAASIFFIFAIANLWISSMIEGPKNPNRLSRIKKNFIPFRYKAAIVMVISIFVGLSSYGNWLKVLSYLNQTMFGVADPIFIKDASFYVFSLPMLTFLWGVAFAAIIITLILVILDYFPSVIKSMFTQAKVQFEGSSNIPQYSSSRISKAFSTLKRKALVHISLLASLIFVMMSIKHYLARYSIMYSDKGIVVGAGYADVVAYLPMIRIVMFLAILTAVVFWIWIFYISKQPRIRKRHMLAFVFALYIIVAFVGPVLVPGLVQSFRVSPNELNLEKPYIESNIKFTQIAYGLSDVEEIDYPAELGLDANIINDAKTTIDNIRILDWRPLTQTYKQTQEIRLYYDLSEVDIDRYNINGEYSQVMISPRELDQRQITSNAQTWVNLHMIYTHGYGVVMSPVNSVTDQGLPNYLIQDIPPINNAGDPNLDVTNPKIYYGEKDNDFVITNTKTEEFDYPKGDTNEYFSYDGEGGIVLDSFFKKLMLAIRFADIKILLSSDITEESRFMFDRNIKDRVQKITPFLAFDSDPYIVLDEGKLYWMVDAYTLTGNFPYSDKFGDFNYIRNPVKVVVDAYHGSVDYYLIDDEPMVNTYGNIFPGLFKPFEQMPEGLKSHIRYPEDLFKVQSEIYSTYHMNDASIFYNQEDAWQIPSEIYGTGQQVKVEPYYMIMSLPNEEEAEFILMTSFTPIRKNNMISWLAVKNDGEDYGEMLIYKFPKDKLIFGPLQIEAKFDQDSDISQQLTLWSQQGSRVTRGNLLVIPINNSLLYVEPLYLQAETGQLPELKRVLVSDGERVVMEETLKEALEALFGIAEESDEDGIEKTDLELIEEANELYANILESMQNQNWTGIGNNLNDLGDILEKLKAE